MPMQRPEDYGTNADGTRNGDYCRYCFAHGQFTSRQPMEEFIESCIPFVLQSGVYPDADTARAQMNRYYPTLKRWKEAADNGGKNGL